MFAIATKLSHKPIFLCLHSTCSGIGISTRTLIVLSLLLLISTNQSLALNQSNLADRPRKPLLATISINDLSSDNRDMAQQLEIWPMLKELYERENPPSLERTVLLRQKIRETILECYFDAESVQAEAAREQGMLEAQRETLIAKRDRNIQINNATNFIASGTLNTIGSALGFTNSIPPFPGNFNQMLSGVVSATLSTYSLRQAAGGKIRGEGHPTLVAELFGRPCDDRTTYPESVWRFLHSKSPEDSTKTRAQLLEDRWIRNNHLERHGARKEMLKIDLLSGLPTARKLMSIDDLNDQITIIGDIDAIVSLMSHHLRDLLSLIDSDVVGVQLQNDNKTSP